MGVASKRTNATFVSAVWDGILLKETALEKIANTPQLAIGFKHPGPRNATAS